MNGAHWHILLNHAPLFGVLTGTLLLIVGMVLHSAPVRQTALSVLIAAALLTIPVYLTGEPAEHVVKNDPHLSVDKHLIHEHEESAEIWLWGVLGLGLLSAFSFFSEKKNTKNLSLLLNITLIAAVITIIGFAKVNNAGGKIRHTEFDSSTTGAASGREDED
jgi:di/tricarboxylate transporter